MKKPRRPLVLAKETLGWLAGGAGTGTSQEGPQISQSNCQGPCQSLKMQCLVVTEGNCGIFPIEYLEP